MDELAADPNVAPEAAALRAAGSVQQPVEPEDLPLALPPSPWKRVAQDNAEVADDSRGTAG
jgi:hypothetical protein